MAARLLFHEKHVLGDGTIVEMVIWQLAQMTTERPHGLKYRLYFGDASGKCLVRYDNERGKGDHRHLMDREETYVFSGVDQLLADFVADIERLRGQQR